MSLVFVVVWLFLRIGICAAAENESCITFELSKVPQKVGAKAWLSHSLDLYHYIGFKEHISCLFSDVHIQLNLTNDEAYHIYQGENCSSVIKQYQSNRRLFGLLGRINLFRSKQLNPFKSVIVGVDTIEPYTIRLRYWPINYFRLATFLASLILFLSSRSLVRNSLFYYSSGCTCGLLASVLLFGFIVYRFTPKKLIGLPIIFGGWSFSLWILYWVWSNFTSLMLQYQKFFAAYFVTVVLISFAILYRYGPPTDVRSHNLAQWALQLVALCLVYASCQIPEVALLIIGILVFWSLTKHGIIYVISRISSLSIRIWRRVFPHTREFITQEEYEKQGEEETRKALEELKQYCRSPKADVWRITSSLKDPKRFASFIDGSTDHVSEEESRLHDLEMSSCDDFSDDDSDDDVREARSYTAYRNQCGDSMNSSQLLHSRGQISARNRLDYSEDIQPIVDSIDLTDEDVRFAFGSNTTNHAKSKSPVDSSVSLYRTGLRSRNEASRTSNRPSHSFYSTFLSDDSSNSSLFEE